MAAQREAILGRFAALYPGQSFPTPAQVLATEEAALRACGFSATKIACLRAIAAGALDGTVPTRRELTRLSDAALIEQLTTIRGVGRWTVEMLLIFTLGRPDVLPVDDFGVRDGYRALHKLEAQPKPQELAEIGLVWAPFRRSPRGTCGVRRTTVLRLPGIALDIDNPEDLAAFALQPSQTRTRAFLAENAMLPPLLRAGQRL